jgi:hypothetical protein
LNLLSDDFDLGFQRGAFVPHVFDERVQALKIIYSGNKANPVRLEEKGKRVNLGIATISSMKRPATMSLPSRMGLWSIVSLLSQR